MKGNGKNELSRPILMCNPNLKPLHSGEKIAAIAEKLDLKKNVVRVWFCNQRQKQKRMKFAAQAGL